jgi:hypothetical protein
MPTGLAVLFFIAVVEIILISKPYFTCTKIPKAVGPSRIALWLSELHSARVRSCGMDLVE